MLVAAGQEYLPARDEPGMRWNNHFAGNFWWTTGAYWASLPPLVGPDYLDPEMHLLQGAGVKAGCLGSSGFFVGMAGWYTAYLPKLSVDSEELTVHPCEG